LQQGHTLLTLYEIAGLVGSPSSRQQRP